MKVTNTGNQTLQGIAQKKSDKASLTGEKETSKLSKGELGMSAEVALSPRARDIKKAKEVAMKSSPDVDEAKVAKFQSLIDSGAYKIDAKKVADKMVDEHLMNSLSSEE